MYIHNDCTVFVIDRINFLFVLTADLLTSYLIDNRCRGTCYVDVRLILANYDLILWLMHGLFKVSAWPIAQHSISDSNSRAPRQRVKYSSRRVHFFTR